MNSKSDSNRLLAALRFLQSRDLFYQFDDQERVVRVAVHDAIDADEIALHLGQLCDLRKLTLQGTNLTDQGLRQLKDLARIEELWLTSPNLSGAGLSSLVGMTEIKELILEAPLDARGLEHISQLRKLQRLSVSGGNFCDDDVAPIAALANLKELSLSENEGIHGTCCAHLIQLSSLNKLTPGQRITDEGLENIARLSRLEELYLEGPFTDLGLLHTRTLHNLRTLCIASEYVTSKGIAVVAELPKLNYLHLNTPGLTDDGVASLVQCSALETMIVSRSGMTNAGIQHLRDAMPKCGVKDSARDRSDQEQSDDNRDTSQPRLDSSTPFRTLLANASDFDLVNGTFVKIGARYGHLVDASAHTPEERVIMLVWHSAGIIGNGGFEYLFAGELDGDPDFRLTTEAYQTAGLDRSYEAFQAAFKLFPSGIVPSDSAERSRLYAMSNKSAREAIDRKLWREDRSHEQQLAEFIRKHVAQLGNLDGS